MSDGPKKWFFGGRFLIMKDLSWVAPRPRKLGHQAATAISGNDITSSCLYISALALVYGGRWGRWP